MQIGLAVLLGLIPAVVSQFFRNHLTASHQLLKITIDKLKIFNLNNYSVSLLLSLYSLTHIDNNPV